MDIGEHSKRPAFREQGLCRNYRAMMAGGDGGYDSHNLNAYAPSAESSVMMERQKWLSLKCTVEVKAPTVCLRLRRDSYGGANARKPLFGPSSPVAREI